MPLVPGPHAHAQEVLDVVGVSHVDDVTDPVCVAADPTCGVATSGLHRISFCSQVIHYISIYGLTPNLLMYILNLPTENKTHYYSNTASYSNLTNS